MLSAVLPQVAIVMENFNAMKAQVSAYHGQLAAAMAIEEPMLA